mmetsp:Transcript_16001/g.35064  ORF Transcript_16001/g.35064 Transcript_16001/m.35064 type:complete len:218 (-) Transcript_16001:397-1050(-)
MGDSEAVENVRHLDPVDRLLKAAELVQPGYTLGHLLVVVYDLGLGPNPTGTRHEVDDECVGVLHALSSLLQASENSHGLAETYGIQCGQHLCQIEGRREIAVAVQPAHMPLNALGLCQVLGLDACELAPCELHLDAGLRLDHLGGRGGFRLLGLFSSVVEGIPYHDASSTTHGLPDVGGRISHATSCILQALQNGHSLSRTDAVQRLPNAAEGDGPR